MTSENKKTITRFAPSPTGLPHLGTAMYALLNYIYARQNDGEVILRFEDTDPVRSKKEYEDNIASGLTWLGITADKTCRQSDRIDIYKKYIAKLIADGSAYVSRETNEEGKTRDVVRFKNPNKVVTFHDSSRGDISVDTTDLKDFVIARDVDSPLYHLTVVVDDFEMGITHVIRGEDGLANTPRQILIQEAIGASRPVYAHYPFVLMPNRMKMGKRNGAVSLQDYMKEGYLPEAVLNFAILLVWHPTDDRELFTLADLIQEFQLERIGKSGAILDVKKLDWLNREYIKKLPPEEIEKNILEWLEKAGLKPDDASAKKLIPIIFDRISKWGDVTEMVRAGELEYFFREPQYETVTLLNGGKLLVEEIKKHLGHIVEVLQNTPVEMFVDAEKTKSLIFDYATEHGRGNVLWPLRVALSGKEKSPDPFTLLYILGKEESVARLLNAIKKL